MIKLTAKESIKLFNWIYRKEHKFSTDSHIWKKYKPVRDWETDLFTISEFINEYRKIIDCGSVEYIQDEFIQFNIYLYNGLLFTILMDDEDDEVMIYVLSCIMKERKQYEETRI